MDWNKASGLSGIGTFVLTFLILAIMVWQIKESPMEPIHMNSVTWLLLMVVAGIVTAAILHWKAARVGHQEFRNQNVLLDGCNYVGCTFRNVTFVYNRTAPFAITAPSTEGPLVLTTENDHMVPCFGFCEISSHTFRPWPSLSQMAGEPVKMVYLGPSSGGDPALRHTLTNGSISHHSS